MKLFIPTIGTRLVLAEPWTFHLHDEYRNEKFYKAFHGEIKRTNEHWSDCRGNSSPVETPTHWHKTHDKPQPIETTLPKGSVIEVDRLYLRKGAGEFDSLTFRLISGVPKVKGRFWAKLNEVNNIEVDETRKEIKWPNGRFVVSIHERQENRASQNCRCGYHHEQYVFVANCPKECICDQTQWPRQITHGLHWQQFPEKTGSRKGVTVNRVTHSIASIAGILDTIEVKKYYSCSGGYHHYYRKDLVSIEELVIWAKRKEFTLEHVTAFMGAFKAKEKDLPIVLQEQ